MEEKEYDNIYAIPANYTDSGKLFGGMLETRNTMEAVLLLVVGYPELMLSIDLTAKIIIMTVTLIPIGIAALIGIGGDSLGQYLAHVLRFWSRKRKLTYRRPNYANKKNKTNRTARKARRRKRERKA